MVHSKHQKLKTLHTEPYSSLTTQNLSAWFNVLCIIMTLAFLLQVPLLIWITYFNIEHFLEKGKTLHEIHLVTNDNTSSLETLAEHPLVDFTFEVELDSLLTESASQDMMRDLKTHIHTVVLKNGIHTTTAIQAFLAKLQKDISIEEVLWDESFHSKILALGSILKKACLVISILFIGIILMFIFLVTKFELSQSNRSIQVLWLLGARKRMIARAPLLKAAKFGCASSILGLIMAISLTKLLTRPLQHLYSIYGISIELPDISFFECFFFILTTVLVTTIAAYLSTTRYLMYLGQENHYGE